MILAFLLFSQAHIGESGTVFKSFSSLWNFYSENRISSSTCGKGYAGVASAEDVSSVFINPASLSLEKNNSIYFEYVYKNDIAWISDIKYKNLNPNFSFAIGLPIGKHFQAGVTYRTENSFKVDYAIAATIIDPDSEEGYAEIDGEFYKNVKISSFSLPLTTKINDRLSIGIELMYTNFYSKQSFGDLYTDSTTIVSNAITADFNKIRVKFGIVLSPVKGLSLGFTYLPETKEAVTVDFGYTSITYEPSVFPWKIGAGISYELENVPLALSLDYKYSNNSVEENLVDRHDIHFGIEYDINDKFVIRTGAFTQMDYRTVSSQLDWEEFDLGNYDQIFGTLGISYKISSLAFNLSLMDSHLFSDGTIKQTYVNTGISYGF